MMYKNFLIIACLAIMVTIFSGCGLLGGDTDSETTKKEVNKGQDQVNMNSDKDNDANSNNPASNEVWPTNMLDCVPEFTYGEIAGILAANEDKSFWIVAYKDVQYDDLESYKVDLEAKGWWDVRLEDGAYGTAALTGQYGDEEYSILLSYMGETEGLQLSVHPIE